MDQWEREYERAIKEQHRNQYHQSLTQEQQNRNMKNNWMEVCDPDGSVHYEPLFDSPVYIDASEMFVPDEESTPLFLKVLLFFAIVFAALFLGFVLAVVFVFMT
jgi:hypothetical protein